MSLGAAISAPRRSLSLRAARIDDELIPVLLLPPSIALARERNQSEVFLRYLPYHGTRSPHHDGSVLVATISQPQIDFNEQSLNLARCDPHLPYFHPPRHFPCPVE